MDTRTAAYQSNHVHHRSIPSNKQQKRHLHRIFLAQIPSLDLLCHQPADEVIFRGLKTLLNELVEVLEELSEVTCQLASRASPRLDTTDCAAPDASLAVELPFVRMAFCWVKNSRSSKGTPRMV